MTAEQRKQPAKCPTCKKPKLDYTKPRFYERETKCKDDFHIWYCGNNYTRYGCMGHRPGDLRCMDAG